MATVATVGEANYVKLVLNQNAGLNEIVQVYTEDDAGNEAVRDLTGWTASAVIKRNRGDAVNLIPNFASFEDAAERLEGKIRLKISNINNYIFSGVGWWTLTISKTGEIPERLLEGAVEVRG